MCEEFDEFENFAISLRDEYCCEELAGMSTFVETPLLSALEVRTEIEFQKFKLEYRIPDLSGIDKIWDAKLYPDVVHAIRSMVGDDETITSNCLIYCVLCVIVGPLLSRIKVSWTDVQFNKRLFNYAEGWVLCPPSMDSSFEAVNKYNRGSGVPYVLDPIKFKDLSAVRKQSDMEQDLPSKFRNLSQKAAWTNPSWFTWNMHQMALLLGLEIFDFARSKVFPFLFQWEGGCGGAPPWNNLYTAAGCIFRYRRGRASKGILGLMNDANQLHTGAIRPDEALFAKNLTLALSGDARWAQLRSELEFRRKDAELMDLPYETAAQQDALRTIPKSLIDKSEIITPSDALTGTALSMLRDKGYITTELDLVMKLEDERRTSAVWGIVPMREIEDQIALRKQEYKEAFLEKLSLLGTKERCDPTVYGAIKELESPLSMNSLLIMERYYKMRVEQASHFSSFIYNEQVRVFKSEDVDEYFRRGTSTLRDGFCESVKSLYRPDWRKSIQLPEEKRQFDNIEKWMMSDSLGKLLTEPMPPGIGPDDARIARDLLAVAQQEKDAGNNGLLAIIVSSDRRLISACQSLVTHDVPEIETRVLGLSVIEFIAYSLSPMGKVVHPSSAEGWMNGLGMINPYRGRRQEPPHGPYLSAIRTEARYLYRASKKVGRVLYDLPNINRALKRFKYDPSTGMVTEFTGGFLGTNRARADRQLPSRSLQTIEGFNDFEYMTRRLVGPMWKRSAKLYSARRGSDHTSW